MGRLTDTGIFTNVHKYDEVTGTYTGLQIASKLNQKNGQDYKLLDAIDIDWNNAWLAGVNSYINNTSDLFQAIDSIANLSDLEWIRDNIDTLNEEVDTILATYVTQDYLNDLLKGYQKPITAGEYIHINSDNQISAYGFLTPDDADDKYATIISVEELTERLNNDYYDKLTADHQSYLITHEVLQDSIVKNADERFDNLEKISDWILDLPIDSINNLDAIVENVNRLDTVVGNTYYNEEEDTYTYTGLVLQTYEITNKVLKLDLDVINLRSDFYKVSDKAQEAYTTANTAYDIAYEAYTSSNESTELAEQAYEMAYQASEKIGVPHSYGYFVELTEEEIQLLEENPNAIEVYSIKEDNLSGIPLHDGYISGSGLQYYTYHPEIPATGFYKDLDDVTDIAYAAQFSADNALFRLYTRTDGTSYAKLQLEPMFNDGNNMRTIVLDLDEADIKELTGEIAQDGIITTYSLYNAFSYFIKPEFITNE